MDPRLLLHRLFFRIHIQDRRSIPRRGGCLVLALYRSPVDRKLLARSIPRKVWFPAVPEEAAALFASGKAVCAFPEGEFCWYGEAAPDQRWFKAAAASGVPVIIASVEGSYDRFPPFSLHIRSGRLTIRFSPCNAAGAETAFGSAVEDERRRDIALRRERIPLDADNIEEMLYICPACEQLFTLQGGKDGTVLCKSCGALWTFLYGKGLEESPGGRILPLGYVENLAANRLKKFRTKQLQFPVSLQHGARGLFILSDDHFILAVKGKSPAAFIFSYNDVESVRLEGRDLLHLVCRQGGKAASFRITPPLHTCLFLLHAVKIR